MMKKLFLITQIILLSTYMLIAQQPFDFIGTPKPSQGSTVSNRVDLLLVK
ncbi:MAG: hypothetical protein IPJ81_17470 [Chitinophagaceae bacterium]|nr:hypothetical protein [Chitinophagaceae bacterium]